MAFLKKGLRAGQAVIIRDEMKMTKVKILNAGGKVLAIFLLVCLFMFVYIKSGQAIRIKDIADIKGARGNQLIGYGLVVGLDGTGDKDAKITIQSIASMLEKLGMTVKAGDLAADNVASVMLTANLPMFARTGSRIDVLVSAIGGSKNLQGGTLLITPLKGADGHVYAVAQGPVSTGGFSAGGASGGRVQKNFPTVGRVVGGAMVEREVLTDLAGNGVLWLSLNNPDFTTVSRVAKVINSALYDRAAVTPDAGTVRVTVPEKYVGNIVGLVTLIEGLNVVPDAAAKIIINERTGTVVMGDNVRISTVAIAHGNLSIQINENVNVSQPLPLSTGQTTATPETDISISEGNNKLLLMKTGVRISEVVRALNALGVTPRDLIAIFQAIKAAGALQAELEII